MTGVIMFERGPGQPPCTPIDLVRSLRRPLGGLLPPLPDRVAGETAPAIDDVVLLTDRDTLTTEAYDVGSDYVRDVLLGRDPGRAWLPKWWWMQANDIEQEVFGRLIAAGDADAYQRARQFLIDYPAGGEDMIEECNRQRVERAATYEAIPDGKVYTAKGRRMWWPCPDCRWPMDVDGVTVRCRYRYHHDVFQIVERARASVRLVRANPDAASRRQAPSPQARDASDALQVDEPTWRFIVVPGASEMRMARALEAEGARVAVYPDFDTYDLDVQVGTQRWRIDLKEHSTIEGLLRHIEENPPAARHIVLPRSHRGQVHAVRDALGDYVVLTEDELRAEVTKALRNAKGTSR